MALPPLRRLIGSETEQRHPANIADYRHEQGGCRLVLVSSTHESEMSFLLYDVYDMGRVKISFSRFGKVTHQQSLYRVVDVLCQRTSMSEPLGKEKGRRVNIDTYRYSSFADGKQKKAKILKTAFRQGQGKILPNNIGAFRHEY